MTSYAKISVLDMFIFTGVSFLDYQLYFYVSKKNDMLSHKNDILSKQRENQHLNSRISQKKDVWSS